MYERVQRDGVAVHTVPSLFESCGIGIAFVERGGGVSAEPYTSLNLASHVDDDPGAVDTNRSRLLDAIGIGLLRERLTTAEQVHGTSIAEVTQEGAGSGAFAAWEGASGWRAPVPGTDALWTKAKGVPLLLLYADCVPVILVRPSIPAVAVVHAGWRGAAAGIVSHTVRTLASLPGADDMLAFVGPHIGLCCYDVGDECVSHFDSAFVTISGATPRLDLGAVVADDLARSGVPRGRQWHLGICTAHNTDRWYSHRAEGLTGRHGALGVIL